MTALYIVSCVFDAFVIYLLFEDILGKRKSSVNKWILMLALLAQQFISSLILNKMQSVYARLIVMIVGTFLLTLFYVTDLVKRFFAMAVFIGFSIIAEGIAEGVMVLLGINKGEEEEIIALFLVEIFLLLLVLFKKIFTKREGNIPIFLNHQVVNEEKISIKNGDQIQIEELSITFFKEKLEVQADTECFETTLLLERQEEEYFEGNFGCCVCFDSRNECV